MRKCCGKESEEFRIITDFWKLYQYFAVPEQSDAYWNELAKKTGAFYDKYKTDLAMKLGFALIDHLQTKYNEMFDIQPASNE